MFDGADLSVVYGNSGNGYYDNPLQPVAQDRPPVAPMPELTVPRSTQSHAMPPDPPYSPPTDMFAQQSPKQPLNSALIPQETFWDRLGHKRAEVAKLVILAFVVLFAIACDRFATHYISAYVAKAFLSETQEFFIRLAYPILIILIVWIIKSL